MSLTYVATVSTAKRIVGVRSADKHLFVVDPGKHSDVILTIILFVRPKKKVFFFFCSGVDIRKRGEKRKQGLVDDDARVLEKNKTSYIYYVRECSVVLGFLPLICL